MEQINKHQSIKSKIFNIEKINPFFSKVRIYVLYEGVNRNGSYFSKESINKAIPTLFNTPIVGEFYDEKENFGGHGATLVKNDKGEFQVVVSTKPYGVVPESALVYWENVVEDNGLEREYLVIDGAYLWSGRYPEIQTIADEGYYGQSMEIEIINGSFSLIEGQQVFDIKDFVFTAFCLLGIDKDSDMYGHVEPAFEKAKVELATYELNKESFKQQFNQMMAELKFTIKEGETKEMENVQAQTDLDNRLKDGVPSQVEPEVVEVDEVVEPVVEPVTEPVLEPTQEPVVAPVTEGEQVEGEDSEPATDGAEPATDGVDNGGVFTVSTEEHESLKSNFELLENEVKELREYKRNRELGDLESRFSNQVTQEEIKAVFEANKGIPIDKIELEIFALIGKKNFSLNKETKESNKIAVVSPKVEKIESNPYGDIFK